MYQVQDKSNEKQAQSDTTSDKRAKGREGEAMETNMPCRLRRRFTEGKTALSTKPNPNISKTFVENPRGGDTRFRERPVLR